MGKKEEVLVPNEIFLLKRDNLPGERPDRRLLSFTAVTAILPFGNAALLANKVPSSTYRYWQITILVPL